MADSLSAYMGLLESPEYSKKSYEEQKQIRETIASAAMSSDEAQVMAPDERGKLYDMIATTSKGMFGRDIGGNERAMRFMNAAEATRNSKKVDLNFIDGFSEGSKNFISGKIGHFLVDIFDPNDLSQEVFDEDTERARKYFSDVSERYDVAGASDYKFAKILGGIGGFAGDAYGSSLLYGAVGAPGLIGKLLSMPGATQAATMGGLSKTGLYIAQMGLESVGFAGEELLTQTITGQMDSSEDWQAYINSLPGTMAKGFGFALAGELVGSALNFGKATGRSIFGKAHIVKPRDLAKMSPEDLMANITSVMRAGEITPEFRKSMLSAGYDEEFIKGAERSAKRAKLVANSAEWINDPKLAMKNTMFAQFNADVKDLPDGFRITGLAGKPLDTPMLVTNQSEFVDAIGKIKNIYTGREYAKASEFGAINSGSVNFKVQNVGTGKSITYDPVKGRDMFQPKSGQVDETLYRELLDESDITKGLEIVKLDNYFDSGFNFQQGKVFIPSKIENVSQGRDALKQLNSQLARSTGGQVKLNVAEMLDRLRKGRNLNYTKEYVSDMLPDAEITYGTDAIKVKTGGADMVFKNLEELGATLHSSEFSDLELAAIMKDRGYALSMAPDGKITVKDDNTDFVYDEFASKVDLMRDPQYRPGRPYQKRWNFTLFTPDSGDILTEDFIKSDALSRQIKKLKEFEVKPALAPTKNIVGKGTINYTGTSKKYIAEMGESGIKKEFNSAEEAETWINKGVQTFREFQDDALDNGFYVWENKGSFNLYAEGMPQPVVTNSLENAKLHMRNQLDAMNLPDMVGDMPPSLVEQVHLQYANVSKAVAKDIQKLGLRAQRAQKTGGSSLFNTGRDFFTPVIDRVKRTGDLEAGKLVEQGVAVDNLFKADFERLTKPLNELKGKFTPTQRRDMGAVLQAEVSPNLWPQKAAELNIELTPEMSNFMSFSRDLMDSAGQTFSVKPDEWIQNYYTRLSKVNPMDLAGASDPAARRKLLNKAFGVDPGGVQEPFFKHLRERDLRGGIFKSDVFDTIETYLRLGKKEQYFKPFSDSVEAYKSRTAKLKDDPVALANRIDLGEMEDKMLGTMYSSERAREMAVKLAGAQQKAKSIMDGVGKYENLSYDQRYTKAQQAVKNDFNVSDLVTSSLLAFKFKMPFRNISQPFITLAPVTGTEYIKRSNSILADKDQFVQKFAELYNKGILPPRSAIDSDLQGPVAWLKKATDKGMDWFYGSDDYTRLVAGVSVSERFRDGLTRYSSKDWDFDKFSKFLKMDFLDGQDKVMVSEMIQKGQFDAAETSLQRIFTRMSMFEYSGLNKPRAHNSGFGKLFGQFGTYPLQFAQLVQKGIKAEGPIYISKLVAANAMVGAFYHDVLGVEDVSMNPLNSATFLGGPMMSNFGQLSQISKGGYTKGDLKSLWNIGTGFIPFYGAGSNALTAFSELNEGSYMDALYSVGSLRATENRYFDTPSQFIEDYF